MSFFLSDLDLFQNSGLLLQLTLLLAVMILKTAWIIEVKRGFVS